MSPDPAAVQAQLEASATAVAEHERLQARIVQATAQLGEAEQERAVCAERFGEEDADVRALQRWGPTRVWSSVRGQHDVDLQQEEAERGRAEQALATATARLERQQAEIAAASSSQRDLGDVRQARSEALAAKEALVRAMGGPVADELGGLAERIAGLRALGAQLVEAQTVAGQVEAQLRPALERFDEATSAATRDAWSSSRYTDRRKYAAVDAALGHLQRANAHLPRLAAELADVEMPPLPGVEVVPWGRVLDDWFDNVFSDLIVRDKIGTARDGVFRTWSGLQAVHRILGERRQQLDGELRELLDQRERLLVGS